ncbi:unnamed protein product [Peniophora sp. CBMAI 1063]|nr:unnamed protein product [Peniophora sp. CBMAI 1063]
MSDEPEKRITLYTHLSSPYSKRVELALAEAGVDYDSHIIDLIRKPEWYVRDVKDPNGKIPALSYGPPPSASSTVLPPPDSFHLSESLVILPFLADLYPALLPPSPEDRARARFFIAKVQERVVPAWFGAITTGEVELDVLVNALKEVQRLLPEATVDGEDESAGASGVHEEGETGYAAGRWSIADAAFGPFPYLTEVYLRNDAGAYAPGFGPRVWAEIFESERFARLQAYFGRVSGRKSWNVMSDERYMLVFLPKFMAYMGVQRKDH